MVFRNRTDAGRQLARALARYRDEDPIVLGLPRGGVPVAYEVARALGAPLDVWVVRKLGAPYQPELGMGAIAEGGEIYLDPGIVEVVGASREELKEIADEELRELGRRVRKFRGEEALPALQDRTVIVVDDGIATGGTMRAALHAIRRQKPKRLVMAVPVASADTLESMRDDFDDVVCLEPSPYLRAIGEFYIDFAPTTDEDVLSLLRRTREPGRGRGVAESDVVVMAVDVELEGNLTLPGGTTSLVLFAHGSGSSRLSPRNRFVAEVLQKAGMGTLLFDLLTPEEEQADALTRHLRFDIDLLADRLVGATDWLLAEPELSSLSIGYFGASTGAAAALVAAAQRPDVVRAVVSRGGRPDLAERHLARVKAPTLLIVGEADEEVLALNEEAFERLRGPKHLAVVPGATHLFEEPGALEEVARLAARWFERHLAAAAAGRRAAG